MLGSDEEKKKERGGDLPSLRPDRRRYRPFRFEAIHIRRNRSALHVGWIAAFVLRVFSRGNVTRI